MIGAPVNIGTASASTGPSISVTVSDVPSGVTIFVDAAIRDSTTDQVTDPSCTDDAANTYERDIYGQSGSTTTQIVRFRCTGNSALSAGQSITVSGLGTDENDARAVTAYYVSGLASPLGNPPSAAVAATEAGVSPSVSVTTTEADTLLLGAICVSSDGQDFGGFNQDPDFSSAVDAATSDDAAGAAGQNRYVAVGNRKVGPAQQYSYEPTLDSSKFWVIGISAYRGAGMTDIDTTSSLARRHEERFLDRIATRLSKTTFAIAEARRHERPWLRWMAFRIEA